MSRSNIAVWTIQSGSDIAEQREGLWQVILLRWESGSFISTELYVTPTKFQAVVCSLNGGCGSRTMHWASPAAASASVALLDHVGFSETLGSINEDEESWFAVMMTLEWKVELQGKVRRQFTCMVKISLVWVGGYKIISIFEGFGRMLDIYLQISRVGRKEKKRTWQVLYI